MSENQDGWHRFISLCLTAKKAETLSLILDAFLTPEEKQDVATRCLIVKHLLEQQQTQRQMSKTLNVSIAKITRGSNQLKRLDRKFINYLKRELNK